MFKSLNIFEGFNVHVKLRIASIGLAFHTEMDIDRVSDL